MKNLAVIPARAGSKSIADKNIVNFLGQPLIARTISSCLDSEVFDYVHVSTDSPEIRSVSLSFGAQCEFLRPRSIAGDVIGTAAAIKHTLEELSNRGLTFDNVFELQPTYVFRSKDLIKEFWLSFEQQQCTSLITCRPIKDTSHPDYAIRMDGDTCVFNIKKPDQFARQDLRKCLACVGLILGGKVRDFLGTGSFFGSDTQAFIVEDAVQIFDINNHDDLVMGENLAIAKGLD